MQSSSHTALIAAVAGATAGFAVLLVVMFLVRRSAWWRSRSEQSRAGPYQRLNMDFGDSSSLNVFDDDDKMLD